MRAFVAHVVGGSWQSKDGPADECDSDRDEEKDVDFSVLDEGPSDDACSNILSISSQGSELKSLVQQLDRLALQAQPSKDGPATPTKRRLLDLLPATSGTSSTCSTGPCNTPHSSPSPKTTSVLSPLSGNGKNEVNLLPDYAACLSNPRFT